MLLSCDAPGLLDVEVENPHCQMAQEAECAQEAEQAPPQPEKQLLEYPRAGWELREYQHGQQTREERPAADLEV